MSDQPTEATEVVEGSVGWGEVVYKVARETIVEDAEREQIARGTWLSSNGTGNPSTTRIVSTFTRTFTAAERIQNAGIWKAVLRNTSRNKILHPI